MWKEVEKFLKKDKHIAPLIKEWRELVFCYTGFEENSLRTLSAR